MTTIEKVVLYAFNAHAIIAMMAIGYLVVDYTIRLFGAQ